MRHVLAREVPALASLARLLARAPHLHLDARRARLRHLGRRSPRGELRGRRRRGRREGVGPVSRRRRRVQRPGRRGKRGVPIERRQPRGGPALLRAHGRTAPRAGAGHAQSSARPVSHRRRRRHHRVRRLGLRVLVALVVLAMGPLALVTVARAFASAVAVAVAVAVAFAVAVNGASVGKHGPHLAPVALANERRCWSCSCGVAQQLASVTWRLPRPCSSPSASETESGEVKPRGLCSCPLPASSPPTH